MSYSNTLKSFLFTATVMTAMVLPFTASTQDLPDEVSVDVEFSDIPIDSALLLLSKESGVNISYDPAVIPAEVNRTLVARKTMLGLLLDNVLHETGLVYRIIGNQLIIVRDPYLEVDEFITVSGYVRDAISGEGLVYANVYNQGAEVGSVSNDYGFYSLTLPKGEQFIHYSYLGYSKEILALNLTNDTTIVAELTPDNQLNEVVIIERIPRSSKQAEQFDDIPIEMMNGMTAFMGEPDLNRLIQMRSGVNNSADGLGGYSVRGGNTDQNLVLLDGVPIYNSGHALGLFSVFNPSVIKSSRLIKGGFPSRYGGRLSSVLDVRIKEGNNRKLSGDVAVSPLMLRSTLEGPIQKGKSSFLLSARRTIVDPWLKPLSRYQLELNDESGFSNFVFYDFNGKVNFLLGERDEIYLSGYVGNDRYENEVLSIREDLNDLPVENMDKNSWEWGNSLGTIRWNHIFSRKLFSHVSLSYSDYSFQNFDFNRSVINPEEPDARLGYATRLFTSDIENFIGSMDFDLFLSPYYYLKFGGNMTRHRIRPGISVSTTKDDLLDNRREISPQDLRDLFSAPDIKGDEWRFYAENEISLGKILVANMGIHISRIATSSRTFTSLQPRAAIRINVSEKNSFRLAFSQMDQFLHLLSTTGLGLPNDVWIPSTDEIAPQRAEELSASFRSEFGKGSAISAAMFYKKMYDLRALAEGDVFAIRDDVDWESQLPSGTGTAYGFEVDAEKRAGKFKGWFNYTYSRSERQFDEINAGAAYFDRHDRRHSFKFNGLYQFNTNVEVSLSWLYGTGSPFTLPTEITPVPVDNGFEIIAFYSSLNNVRLPDYHKLDISVNLYSEYSWGKQKLTFGAYNLYNRNNPFYIDFVSDAAGSQNLDLESVSILPLIPYISLGIAF